MVEGIGAAVMSVLLLRYRCPGSTPILRLFALARRISLDNELMIGDEERR